MGGFSRDLVRVYIFSWWVLSHPSEKYATVKLDSIFANIGIKITTNGALMAFQSWLGYKRWIWSHASSSNLTNSPRLKHNSCVAASPCQFWAIKALQRKCEVFAPFSARGTKSSFMTCPCWCPPPWMPSFARTKCRGPLWTCLGPDGYCKWKKTKFHRYMQDSYLTRLQ